MAKRYTDEQALVKLDKAKGLLTGVETENPTKDFTRIRSLLDLVERAILAQDYDAETAALLEYEQEWFRLGMTGFTQKRLDC